MVSVFFTPARPPAPGAFTVFTNHPGSMGCGLFYRRVQEVEETESIPPAASATPFASGSSEMTKPDPIGPEAPPEQRRDHLGQRMEELLLSFKRIRIVSRRQKAEPLPREGKGSLGPDSRAGMALLKAVKSPRNVNPHSYNGRYSDDYLFGGRSLVYLWRAVTKKLVSHAHLRRRTLG